MRNGRASVGERARSAAMELRALAAELFDELATCSIGGPGITRDTFGAGEQAAQMLVEKRAAGLGFETRRDAASNLYITLPGHDRAAPAIMFGSHLDSVPQGGNFDGAAGVVGGLLAMLAIRELGLTPSCDVTTMAIRAEESIWFQTSYIGSRAAFGVLPDGALDAKRVDTGRTLAEHMADCGVDVDLLRLGADAAELDVNKIRAFVEIHIEQAPQLVEANTSVAVGTGSPGNFRYPNIVVRGEHAHVGLPRRFRKDAMLAASDFACGLDDIWLDCEAAGRPMAFTIGRAFTDSERHGLTIVPGTFTLSLDVRAYDEDHLSCLEAQTLDLARSIEAKRGVAFDFGVRASALAAPSEPRITEDLFEAAKAVGIDTMPLASPASHDAATFGAMGVPTAMLFVRNRNGSHNPDEAMEISDFMDATAILTAWLAAELSGDVGADGG